MLLVTERGLVGQGNEHTEDIAVGENVYRTISVEIGQLLEE